MRNLHTVYDVITVYDVHRCETAEERDAYIAGLPQGTEITVWNTQIADPMTATEIEQMAQEIRAWLIEHNLWMDCRIYFNGKAYATDRTINGHTEFAYNNPQKLFILENEDPRNYFEYVGDILSMSFEGDLYDILNSEYSGRLYEDFSNIFERHDCYYELGNSWNLTAVYKYQLAENEDIKK